MKVSDLIEKAMDRAAIPNSPPKVFQTTVYSQHHFFLMKSNFFIKTNELLIFQR